MLAGELAVALLDDTGRRSRVALQIFRQLAATVRRGGDCEALPHWKSRSISSIRRNQRARLRIVKDSISLLVACSCWPSALAAG